MTPYVQVKPFAPDFNYWGALVHGHRAGWDYLTYGGGSSAELCYQIWSLSDIIAFSSAQKAPETGWLASICYRFGRPIFCTEWNAPAVEDIVLPWNALLSANCIGFPVKRFPLNCWIISRSSRFLPNGKSRRGYFKCQIDFCDTLFNIKEYSRVQFCVMVLSCSFMKTTWPKQLLRCIRERYPYGIITYGGYSWK